MKINCQFGKLYLIPTLLGDTEPSLVLPVGTIKKTHDLDIFIVENLRSARRFLSKIKTPKIIDDLTFLELNKHTKEQELLDFLLPAFEGKSIGLLSEAGTPCVADPGNVIVELAHQAGIQVVPLIGPNAILLALMASGFNGQAFAFHGYLPIQQKERTQALLALQKRSGVSGETQIFIETPFRNQVMFEAVLQTCQPNLMLCIAMNISMPDETIKSMSVSEWKSVKIDLNKKPTVFLLWIPPSKSKNPRKH